LIGFDGLKKVLAGEGVSRCFLQKMDQEGEGSEAFLLSGRFSLVEGDGEAECGQMRRQELGEARFPVADEGENDRV
jgi:hypothetical protein